MTSTVDMTDEQLQVYAFRIIYRELGAAEYFRFVRGFLREDRSDVSAEIRARMNAMSPDELRRLIADQRIKRAS